MSIGTSVKRTTIVGIQEGSLNPISTYIPFFSLMFRKRAGDKVQLQTELK